MEYKDETNGNICSISRLETHGRKTRLETKQDGGINDVLHGGECYEKNIIKSIFSNRYTDFS